MEIKLTPVFPVISYLVTDDLKLESGQLGLIVRGMGRPMVTLMLAIDNSKTLRNDLKVQEYKRILIPTWDYISFCNSNYFMDDILPLEEWCTFFDTLAKLCDYLQGINYFDYLILNTVFLATEELKYFCFVFKKANE